MLTGGVRTCICMPTVRRPRYPDMFGILRCGRRSGRVKRRKVLSWRRTFGSSDGPVLVPGLVSVLPRAQPGAQTAHSWEDAPLGNHTNCWGSLGRRGQEGSGVCGERHGTDPGSKPCWMGEGEDTERGSEGGSVARKARRALGTWLRGTLVGMAGRTTATKRPQADSVAEERSELRGQLTDGTQTLPCGHENAKRGTGGLSPRWLAEEGGLRAAGSKRKAGHGRSLVLSVDTALDDLRHGTPGMRGSGRCAGELTLMRWCDLTSS